MSPIVLRGRDAELATVMTAVRSAAAAGQGAMIVIAGEPGIGKSALLRAAADQAGDAGFVAGFGKADEIDQIAPGAPLLVALRSRRPDHDGPGRGRAQRGRPGRHRGVRAG